MVAPGSSCGGSALSTAELRKAGLTLEDLEGPDVTCRDLGRACCTHDAKGWRMLAVYMFGVCFFLYFFLFRWVGSLRRGLRRGLRRRDVRLGVRQVYD